MVAALEEVIDDHGLDATVLVVDDNSPDGTGELADRLAEESRRSSRPPPRSQGGPGACVHRRVSRRGRGGRRARAHHGLRLLPRSRRRSPPRRCRRRGRRRDRLALRGRRRCAQLGPRAPRGQPRGLPVRPGPARRRHPRPDRRLQVLPARGARAHRPRPHLLEGLRLPDRDDLPRLRAGFRVVEVPIVFTDREAGARR